MRQPAIILASLLFALIGGIWLIFLLGQAVSVASAVGLIALAGLSSEFGMITAPLLSLFVLPAVYKLLGRKRFVEEELDADTPMVANVAHPNPL